MQADQWPVVAIVGAGAVGCYFGGMLARSGVRVTLIGRAFQNGVDNVDRIYAAIHWRAIPVAVYVAAQMSGPGHLTHTGRGDLVIGHHAGWPRQPNLEPLAAMFEHAGISCRISEAIEEELWTKLVMNCVYNAISALTRARYGRSAWPDSSQCAR